MVRELFITGSDAAVAFDPAEEVLPGVALAAETTAEPTGPAATGPWRNTGPHALIVQPLAEASGVESPVGGQPAVAQARQEGRAGQQVVLRSGRHRRRPSLKSSYTRFEDRPQAFSCLPRGQPGRKTKGTGLAGRGSHGTDYPIRS